MLEKTVVKEIKGWLNSQEKSHFIKIHGNSFGKAGVSDLLGVFNGRFFAIEVKAPGKEETLTRLQKLFIDKINECGGKGFVTSNLDFVKRQVLSE